MTSEPAQADENHATPGHGDIAVRAYYIYLENSDGDEHDHWLRAEHELTAADREAEEPDSPTGPSR